MLLPNGRHTRQIWPTWQSELFPAWSLEGVQNRRANVVLTPDEQTIREEILAGLISDVLQVNLDQHRNVYLVRMGRGLKTVNDVKE